ncbi:hypothetical protein CALCODRAFT_502763 [Calocera cornea HHB12733]|uniref:Uncharacterized protein n=1 Tax=Calocera cornea HHB12733 TaxID=1353952 RepID=A0A165D4E2_9BASI|nr:hypothetical protein CALCODRAFT_502763 [Calocera cornea HHB12733]
MASSFAAYNISLNSSSPTFIYEPFQNGWYALDGDPDGGWRTSFSDIGTWPKPGVNNVGTGVPLRETFHDGANVTMHFEGTAVYLCLTSIGSSFTFVVDDSPVSTTGPATDPACAHSGGQIMAYADGLTYGNHTATVRVNAQDNPDFLFYGGLVTVGVNGTNPVEQRIDDSDPGWSYEPEGVWIFSNSLSNTSSNYAVGDYNTTRHWMCSYGPSYTASYTFDGSSAVQLLGMLNLNMGPYTIQLDSRSYSYNGSDLWRESQQVLFFQGALDPTTEHTITLINYDQAAPNAQQPVGPDFYPCVAVDGLILTKTTPTLSSAGGAGNSTSPSPGSSGRSSSTGPIVGGVVGGVAALCIAAFILWLIFWRRRHTRPTSPERTEIDPMLDSLTEVTPYPMLQTVYSPIQGVRGQSTPEAYEGASTPMAQTASTRSLPLVTARTGRRDGKADRDRHTAHLQPTGRATAETNSVPSSTLPPPSRDPSSDRPDITTASTQELVGILNQRLRNEYRAENEDLELPTYEPVA